MVAEEGGFIAVRFEYLNLPVLAAAIIRGGECCVAQRVKPFVHTWQRMCIPYRHRVQHSVLDTETQFFVFPGGNQRACPSRHCGLDYAFLGHSVNLLNFVLCCPPPGLIWMFDCWTGVWFQIDLMLDGDNFSCTPVPHALELARNAQDVLPYGIFLAADVDLLSSLFCVHVGFLNANLV